MKKSLFIISILSLCFVSCSSTPSKTNNDFSYASTTYVKDGKTLNLTMDTLYTNQGNPHYDTFDNQRVLVVPFGFTDSDLQSKQNDNNIKRIKTAFFGTEEEINEVNGYYSVKDYYYKSSYGKSSFEGDVLPNWLIYEGTSDEFYSRYSNKPVLGDGASEYIRDWYIAEYNKDNHGLLGENANSLSYYDQNNDGFIDLMWIVYSHKSTPTNIASWWAYVNYKNTISNLENPEVKTYGFASIDFLDSGYNGYDTHIFIHETGHAYGLLDYYDYSNSWAPLGKLDMMDNSVGDHNAFSKFTLGWLSPLVVDDSAIITIKDTSLTGDCFIIPSNNYNNTAFDEYIMVELVTPNGLANKDTLKYDEAGIRLTHCDARVFKDNHDSYLETNVEEGNFFRVNNTKGGREGLKKDTDYYITENGRKNYYSLISLIESTVDKGYNCLNNYSYEASDSSLFKKNDQCNLNENNLYTSTYLPSGTSLWNKSKTISSWQNATTQNQVINNEYRINYSIKVLDIKLDESNKYVATIEIKKY